MISTRSNPTVELLLEVEDAMIACLLARKFRRVPDNPTAFEIDTRHQSTLMRFAYRATMQSDGLDKILRSMLSHGSAE